jgi:hypothetical protein
MRTMLRMSGLAAAGLALLLAVSSASAQQPLRVRGTIEAVDGSLLTVKSRDGSTLKVKVSDNVAVRGVVKASLSDVKAGTYVGITAMPQADGSRKAVEVHIFPEAMRGTGEGDRPWDLQPNSTMTNANIDVAVAGNNGQELTLKYKDGEKKFLLAPDTTIVTFVPGDKSELKPGAKIFVNGGTKTDDGTIETSAVTVGRDGLTPPM